MHGRWAGVVARNGYGVINGHGLDVRVVSGPGELSGYLAKVEAGWSIGSELARADRKTSTPMRLLTELVETGEARWAALWGEYESATFGRRAIVWSAGLRALLLGVEDEMSDEEAPLVASAQAHALLAVALRLRDAQPGSTP